MDYQFNLVHTFGSTSHVSKLSKGMVLKTPLEWAGPARAHEHNENIPMSVRKIWCRQVVQAVKFIHSHGIIHSDLRPDNFLVHATTPKSLDLWLCDFGGSTCERLGLDGGHLPDSGFWDPNGPWVSTISTDIFSVGSILYSIVTGHWPYSQPGPQERTEESVDAYSKLVDNLFGQGQFPNVDKLYGGRIIHGCWTHAYATADEILKDLDCEDAVDVLSF